MSKARKYNVEGEMLTTREICERLPGIPRGTIQSRLYVNKCVFTWAYLSGGSSPDRGMKRVKKGDTLLTAVEVANLSGINERTIRSRMLKLTKAGAELIRYEDITGELQWQDEDDLPWPELTREDKWSCWIACKDDPGRVTILCDSLNISEDEANDLDEEFRAVLKG